VLPRLLGTAVAALAVRALRVRLSVSPRQRWWDEHRSPGGLRLVALGDSLTQGTGASSPARAFLGLVAADVARRTGRDVDVVNRAVYGAKVADVLARQLPVPADADLVTLCVGSNDAGRTEPEVFRERLRAVCAQLPAGSLVGDVPEFQWGPRVPAAAALSQVVREVVAEHPGLVLAPVERETTGTSILTELAGDFFHPNDRGHARIARAFTGVLGQALPA
jgi:lysophospholipase L1-like esterase